MEIKLKTTMNPLYGNTGNQVYNRQSFPAWVAEWQTQRT